MYLATNTIGAPWRHYGRRIIGAHKIQDTRHWLRAVGWCTIISATAGCYLIIIHLFLLSRQLAKRWHCHRAAVTNWHTHTMHRQHTLRGTDGTKNASPANWFMSRSECNSFHSIIIALSYMCAGHYKHTMAKWHRQLLTMLTMVSAVVCQWSYESFPRWAPMPTKWWPLWWPNNTHLT